MPNAFLCGRYYPCDGFTKRRAIQRCEDITGSVAIVGSSAGIIVFLFSVFLLCVGGVHPAMPLRKFLLGAETFEFGAIVDNSEGHYSLISLHQDGVR